MITITCRVPTFEMTCILAQYCLLYLKLHQFKNLVDSKNLETIFKLWCYSIKYLHICDVKSVIFVYLIRFNLSLK